MNYIDLLIFRRYVIMEIIVSSNYESELIFLVMQLSLLSQKRE
jgi:hypothetical protein